MALSRLAGAMLAAWMSVSAPAFAQEAQPAPNVEVDVAGTLSIDAVGAVSDVEFNSEVPAEIASIVKQAVHGWKFEPVMRDGTPMPAKSSMQLFLVGVPQGGGFRLRVERAQFGFPRKIRQSGRKGGNLYPMGAMRARVMGQVVLAVRVDAAGNVLDAVPLRSRLLPQLETSRFTQAWRSSFEQSAVQAARAAKYEPVDPALPGGGNTALITNVAFTLQHDYVPTTSIWTQRDTAVNFTGIPTWLGGGKLDEGVIDHVREGQDIAFGNGPVLRTQVVGTLL